MRNTPFTLPWHWAKRAQMLPFCSSSDCLLLSVTSSWQRFYAGLPSPSRKRKKSTTSSSCTLGNSPAYNLYTVSLKSLFLQCFPRLVFTSMSRESKVASSSKDKKTWLWKTGLGLWFPNSLYLPWCACNALYCWQNKQHWEKEFWRASHIPSLTITNG